MFSRGGACSVKNPYCVVPFSEKTFKALIKRCTLANEEFINDKQQLSYLYSYLATLKASSIIVESHYIDKSYLEDYSEYYVKCFKNYQREVNRLHFFSSDFDKTALENILNTDNNGAASLQKHYLGFITLKKLPKTFIGKTCLKTLEDSTSRYFASLREYNVNLFGIDLKIDALAYQEQDSTVCACATCSLWSIFHATGKLFQHKIPSPVEITKLAAEQASSETRIFPNKSLNLRMIAQGIKNIGLEPYKIEITDVGILRASIHAYLKANIPMLLAFELYNIEKKEVLSVGHAVAVIGYNVFETEGESFSPFKLKSDNINKIYVHDDQVGPYAKMNFENGLALSTSYEILANGEETHKSLPFALSIPLYKNIRIPFGNILKETFRFNNILNFVYENTVKQKLNLEWDIYLQTSIQLKSSIFKNNSDIFNAADILTASLPSYIWCCEMILDKATVMNVLFDATDIETNLNLIGVIKYNSDGANNFYEEVVLHSRKMYETHPVTICNQFICWFSSQSDFSDVKAEEEVLVN